MRRRKAFKLTKKERALAAVNLLREMYPNAICSLDYEFPFQLLVAVRLSAQCTDARVNLVTPALFERYKTIEDFANADPAEVEAILSLDIAGAVIATGGSVVYSDAAMCHLKETGKVIYLHLSFEEMQNRINNLSSRGIALENGETLRDMYDKRLPLYEKYADAVVDCCGNSIETTVEKIIAAVQK